ncbi:protein YIPF1, partial [Trifolium pratense]
AVIVEEDKTTKHVVPDSKIQIFPPAANGGDRRPGGYQTIGTPTGNLRNN